MRCRAEYVHSLSRVGSHICIIALGIIHIHSYLFHTDSPFSLHAIHISLISIWMDLYCLLFASFSISCHLFSFAWSLLTLYTVTPHYHDLGIIFSFKYLFYDQDERYIIVYLHSNFPCYLPYGSLLFTSSVNDLMVLLSQCTFYTWIDFLPAFLPSDHLCLS